MRVRFLMLAALALGVAACDAAEPDICLVIPDGYAEGEISRPSMGDTLRLGEPFVFEAEYRGEGHVVEYGLQLVWTDDLWALEDSLLYRLPLGSGAGTHRVERRVTIDTLRGGATASSFAPGGQFYLYAYGRTQFADCGGAGGQEAGYGVRVVLLDRAAPQNPPL